jgi:hypothetical protein
MGMELSTRAKAEEAPLLENAMPKFVDALGKITEAFAAALEGQNHALVQVAQAVREPKKVSLDGIKRNADGMLTGASATVQ